MSDPILTPDILAQIPPKWLVYGQAAFLLLMILGRVFTALKSSGGLVGIWNSIVFGSSTAASAKPGAYAGRSILTLLAGVLLSFGLVGCSTWTVKPGADPVVVWSEYTQEMALDTFDAFLKWERSNEAVLLKVNPGIHQAAETIRQRGPGWFVALAKANRAYKADRNVDNLNALRAAQAVLDQALLEAKTYIALHERH